MLRHFTTGEKPEKLPKVNALNELIPMLSLKDVQIAAAQDFWGTDALYVSWIFSKCTDFCSRKHLDFLGSVFFFCVGNLMGCMMGSIYY